MFKKMFSCVRGSLFGGRNLLAQADDQQFVHDRAKTLQDLRQGRHHLVRRDQDRGQGERNSGPESGTQDPMPRDDHRPERPGGHSADESRAEDSHSIAAAGEPSNWIARCKR